ncbi:hypothetical protein HZB58_01790, partial [Candidatus Gottesmanbacteria bacterium]|nr:hypothetical protein [Candidatus Gottesmanbacteria bacterium]
MTDDILDAAQKAINDAAKSVDLPPDPQPPEQPSPLPAPEPAPATQPPILPENPENREKNPPDQKNPESVIVPPVPSQQHHSAGPKKPSKGPLIALIALLLLVLPVSVYFI